MPSFSLISKTITSALLVAGTCIGGGMLALPLASAPGGFFPSLTYMSIVWLAMTATGLCLVEVGLWMKRDDIHLISMASTILGKWGKYLVWILFTFISYASLAAYTGGCGKLIAKGLYSLFSIQVSKAQGCLLFTLLAAPVLLGPRRILGRTNDIIFFLMIGAYFVIIAQGIGFVREDLLFRNSWADAPMGVPLLITAFSCQMMIPSLHSFLDNHKKALRTAVILGTTLAFAIYALWQLVIFGSIPFEGQWGLAAALALDEPATYCLEHLTHSPLIPPAATLFALFALITSFFGIGMGLFDFLADGLHIKRKGKGLAVLAALVLVPSLFFAIRCERIFITALDISGGFGDTILNGVIPILMLWVGAQTIANGKFRIGTALRGFLILLLCLYISAFGLEMKLRLSEESHSELFESS